MTDFILKLSEENANKVKSSIRIIKEYIKANEQLKEDIKGNNEEIKNEYKTVLVDILGKEVAQIALKHAKDSELADAMTSELETVDFLKGIIHV